MTRRALIAAVAFSAFGAGHLEGQQPSAGGASLYDVALFEDDLMLPMRDGTRLSTDVYRPARDGEPVEGRFPVLLARTPYNKDGRGGSPQVEYFVRNGYVVVIQDTRGRHESEGLFTKYNDFDARDGYDTMEWIVGLPYSTGQIGTWGTSYGAHTQADAAKLDPPGLVTMVLNMGGTSNSWDHGIRYHGAFELGWQIMWAFRQVAAETRAPFVRAMLEREVSTEWVSAVPFRRGLNPLSVAPNFEDYFLTMQYEGADTAWQGLGESWEPYYDQTADVPMIHIGGWYDLFSGGTVDNYVGLSGLKSAPVRLLVGPWDHGGNAKTFTGDVEFGPTSAIGDFANGFHLRWFNHFLKGEQNGVDEEAPVRVFVMGTGDGHRDQNGRLYHGGYWREEQDWPLPGTRFVEYFFQGGGGLSPDGAGSGAAATTYTFDPEHPVPTIGGQFYWKYGGFDQRESPDFSGSRAPYLPLKSRPDVVVFQTPPLEDDMEVVGPIEVRLLASSSALDTDFTAKLVDVYPASRDYPSGYDLNLTEGIIRARFRDSPSREELMTPGEVYEIVIDLFPTANVFKKGHRIRVDVSSSNFPRFDVNPNTGEPLGRHRQSIKADNTIHHSQRYRSRIVLPVVPHDS